MHQISKKTFSERYEITAPFKQVLFAELILQLSLRDNSAITRIIDVMEKKEYLQRTVSQTDRRVKYI